MKKIILPFFTYLLSLNSFAQTNSDAEIIHKESLEKIIYQQESLKSDSIIYTDTVHGYELVIPLWWKIKETKAFMFGGTFPAIGSVENALLFKSFDKEEFSDINDFENWVIRDYSIGKPFKWSSQHFFMLRKELNDFNEIGNSFWLQLIRGNKIYNCCYILFETSKSYVWVDFTSTSDTYDKNFPLLKDVMSIFKKK